MDITNKIKNADYILRTNYLDILLEQARKGKKRLVIDFKDIIKYDSSGELSHYLLDNPEETLKVFQIAAENILGDNLPIQIRVKNTEQHNTIPINMIRADDISKFITISGNIKSRSPVTFKISSAVFECTRCAALITILQPQKQLIEPSKCHCGNVKFRQSSSKIINGFSMMIEQNPESSETNELAKINVLLEGDLTDDKIEPKLTRSTRIKASGILKTFIKYTGKGKSVELDHYLEVNYIKIEKEDENLDITSSDKEQIIKYSQDPNFVNKVATSLFDEVSGYNDIKEALILQAFGGKSIKRDGNLMRRGDLHILIVGEPGIGKSFILQIAKSFLPKFYFFIAGKRTSEAGLLCGVVRDELLGINSIEAGAMPMAHGGILLIDEFDKLDKNDREGLHGPMEQQVVTNTKIIKATLKCECGVLAVANPKDGVFSHFNDIVKCIDLPSTLVNRFDLIYPLRDIIDSVLDVIKAKKILGFGEDFIKKDEYITPIMFKKYLIHSSSIQPKFNEELLDHLSNKYKSLREKSKNRNIIISPRQLISIKRLAEAKAKSRLSDKVTINDVDYAMDKIYHSLKLLLGVSEDIDIENMDISYLELGIKLSKKQLKDKLILIIKEYNENNDDLGMSFTDIMEKCKMMDVEEKKVDDLLNLMKLRGEIYEPTHDKYKLTL